MNAPREEEKTENNLSDSDEWFLNNVRCLLSNAELLVKRGQQKHINRQALYEWIGAYLEIDSAHPSKETLPQGDKNK